MELVQEQRGPIPNSAEQCRCESGLRWLDTALDMVHIRKAVSNSECANPQMGIVIMEDGGSY